jgi:hypothetical protein
MFMPSACLTRALLLPGAELLPDRDDLSYVIGGVVDHQQDLVQVGLSMSAWNRCHEPVRAIARQAL